ncbi:hypothetical protein [Mucilaginibacter ginsenosidivorax]|uniref:Uncharacterized protein n=1 Tax=Mucilaginibacter ginsenosidivorax TaxID=862126 RepID=A0A5B8W0X9_9SPHI|nr:hypothetical protein [Mucilaginibacter ginsenosidivorax]QEC77321.1 hypothetical protein FSB76_15720 [Mucilaginibacter ginsenosidivorax]
MKEVTIKYKNSKTLDALKDLGKYLGFSVSEQRLAIKGKQEFYINGVTVIPGDETIDVSELHEVFTGKGMDAAELRKSGWQRKK